MSELRFLGNEMVKKRGKKRSSYKEKAKNPLDLDNCKLIREMVQCSMLQFELQIPYRACDYYRRLWV